MSDGAVAFADIDADNDLDLIITGKNVNNNAFTRIYKNDASGNFTWDNAQSIWNTSNGDVNFADVDGDNDLDLLISGSGKTLLYLMDNNGIFSFNSSSIFNGSGIHDLENSSIDFGDFDNDGDLDVITCGRKSNFTTLLTRLYLNDGNGAFNLDSVNSFQGLQYSDVVFADIDGDNDLDILVAGLNASSETATKLYKYCTPKNGIDFISSCGPYTWIDGITYTESNSTATFNLIGGANGCDSMAFLDLTINNVNVGVTQNRDSLRANSSGTSYQWLNCNANFAPLVGENDSLFIAKNDGAYAVEIKNGNCIDTSSCFTVNSIGIDPMQPNGSISIYPNPSNGILHIDMANINNAILKIVNTNGKQILFNHQLKSGISKLELDQSSGVYIIQIETKTGISYHKLILAE